MTFALEIALVVFVVVSAVAVAFLRDVLGAIVVFASFTLGLAMIWVILQAPDVALTEAAVGAGVMSVLFLLTVARTTRTEGDEGYLRPVNFKALAIVFVLFVILLATVPALPEVGDPNAPAVQETVDGAQTPYGVADDNRTPYGYYIEQTPIDAGIRNAVAAVLVVYRGLDTFGEAVVVFSAIVGVLVVLRREEAR